MDRLKGKIAIISGAATGIGAATARRFVAEGAKVGILDVNAEDGRALAHELAGTDEQAQFFVCDVTDPDSARNAVGEAVDALGGLDVVFANAGLGTIHVGGTVEDLTPDRWDLAFDVNVRGMYTVTGPAIQHLRARGGGSVIMTASVFATIAPAARPTHGYVASKGAVAALARALAVTYGPEGIRVNSISPGLTRTRLIDDLVARPEAMAAVVAGIPLRREAQPSELAAAALFLASDDASYVTGQDLVVDGGMSVQ